MNLILYKYKNANPKKDDFFQNKKVKGTLS
jgi:hypothetical protein